MKDNYENALIDMKFSEMLGICESLDIDTEAHSELIYDMFWDGHSAYEIKQAVEVEEGDCSL
jgi:hypothetical protein